MRQSLGAAPPSASRSSSPRLQWQAGVHPKGSTRGDPPTGIHPSPSAQTLRPRCPPSSSPRGSWSKGTPTTPTAGTQHPLSWDQGMGGASLTAHTHTQVEKQHPVMLPCVAALYGRRRLLLPEVWVAGRSQQPAPQPMLTQNRPEPMGLRPREVRSQLMSVPVPYAVQVEAAGAKGWVAYLTW